MKSYLIIFQLGFLEDTYTNMITFLKTAPQWARPMPNVWIIKTSTNSAGIRDGLKSRVNSTDKVFVIALPNNDWATSNITKQVTDWMKNNL